MTITTAIALFQIAGNFVECVLKLGPEHGDGGDYRAGHKGADQRVFDRSRARFIAHKTTDRSVHDVKLLPMPPAD
jgi:hypothetical protein